MRKSKYKSSSAVTSLTQKKTELPNQSFTNRKHFNKNIFEVAILLGFILVTFFSFQSEVKANEEAYRQAAQADSRLVACNKTFQIQCIPESSLKPMPNPGTNDTILVNPLMIENFQQMVQAGIKAGYYNDDYESDFKISSAYRNIEEQKQLRRKDFYQNVIEVYVNEEIEQNQQRIIQDIKEKYDEIKKDCQVITTVDEVSKRIDQYYMDLHNNEHPYLWEDFLKEELDIYKYSKISEYKDKYKNTDELMNFLKVNIHNLDDVLLIPDLFKDINVPSIIKKSIELVNQKDPYPGYSDHHTGLAIDLIIFPGGEFHQWLLENAHHFGFIFRYTEQSQQYTGVGPEYWHLRYVGVSHAERIHELNTTLDEYIISGEYKNVSQT